MTTVIKNGQVLGDNFSFKQQDIKLSGEIIDTIGEVVEKATMDAKGLYVVPGLIDIHTHGCNGCDFCDGKISSLETISNYLAHNGITSFLGTSMSLSEEKLHSIFKIAKDFISENKKGAYMHGINMEGPFFNELKKGAQSGDNLKNPVIEMFHRLNESSGNNIRVCCLSPELDGSDQFISTLKDSTVISLAHTTADYDISMKAIDLGASNITHLYNAMAPFTHRSPGLVGAAFDSNVSCELICDGIHVHPAVIRSTFKTVGAERIILVSDSMCACGLSDGIYELGGQKVIVKDSTATLENGTIAGSTTNLMSCVKNCVDFGIPLEDALKAASINPAKLIGVDDITGSIAVGKYADLVLMDEKFHIKHVFVKGKQVI